jgi:hypothetical protein
MEKIIFFIWKIFSIFFLMLLNQTILANSNILPSWNEGKAKSSIINIVEKTTIVGSPDFVLPENRIATFDQDGTLWVEHPMYSQFVYVFDKIQDLAKKDASLKMKEPFKTILSKNSSKISKLTDEQLNMLAVTALTGMDLETYNKEVKEWLSKAKDPRWKKNYTSLVYLPMIELLHYLRDNGYKTFIITGGGQNFVRIYSNEVYGIPTEQVMGTSFVTKFSYKPNGEATLFIDPQTFIEDNLDGKVRGIELLIGKKPIISVGNTAGDREMLEYATSGENISLGMLVLHDDDIREYAYGPAQNLPDTKVGAFDQSLYDEAIKKNWTIISMKNDWNQIFSFDSK